MDKREEHIQSLKERIAALEVAVNDCERGASIRKTILQRKIAALRNSLLVMGKAPTQ